jgi:hypothetical protein
MAEGKEPSIEARATLRITGGQYAQEGSALISIEARKEGFFFHWKAQDSEGTEIAEETRTILMTMIDDPSRPRPFLEQYIRTNIQMTKLKRKNRLKVVGWAWAEK